MTLVYQHGIHAGNHGDVFKHLILARLIALRDPRLTYVDTHAGCGLYDLSSPLSTGEWRHGVGRLWAAPPGPPPLLDEYLSVVRGLNPDDGLRYCPGSAEVVRQLSDPRDTLDLCETDEASGALLRHNYGSDPRVSVHVEDGWTWASRFVPPGPLVVLIDPPYVAADDPEQALDLMWTLLRVDPEATVLIWYPIEAIRDLTAFHAHAPWLGIARLARVELQVAPVTPTSGLSGSGLLIANPPEPLVDEIAAAGPWLAALLGRDHPRCDVGWV